MLADVRVAPFGNDFEREAVLLVERRPRVHPALRAKVRVAGFEMTEGTVRDGRSVGLGEEPL